MNYLLRTASVSKCIADLGTIFEGFANVTIFDWELFGTTTRAYCDNKDYPVQHPRPLEIVQGDDVRGFIPLRQLIPVDRLYKVRRV